MQSNYIRFTLSMLLLIPTWSASAQTRKLAVVVGVDTYRSTSNLPRLQHAGADAALLSDVLREQGFTVFEMTHLVAKNDGQEAMAPNLPFIRDQIDGVLGFPNLGADDTVIISLHGHGVQFDDGQGTNAKFYFCPADSTIFGARTNADLSERNHLLPLDEIYEQLAQCPAATKLLIVDACRNDPTRPNVFRSGLASSTLPKLPPPTGGTAAFFSCKANQQAVEDPELKHGVFTHYLVKGLRGAADQTYDDRPADGAVTFGELSAYVANNTYSHTYANYKVRQSPELRGDFDLNFKLTQSYSASSTHDLPTESILREQLRIAFRSELNNSRQEAMAFRSEALTDETREQHSDRIEKTRNLKLFSAAYAYARDTSTFGLEEVSADERSALLALISDYSNDLLKPPGEREVELDDDLKGAIAGVRNALSKWPTWETLDANSANLLAVLIEGADIEASVKAAIADASDFETALDGIKQRAIRRLSSVLPAASYEACVLYAIRDRYWCVDMLDPMEFDALPRLHLSTVLECAGFEASEFKYLFAGRPVALQFSALDWCNPCQATLPHWMVVQEKVGEKMELVFVGCDGSEESFARGKRRFLESRLAGEYIELPESGGGVVTGLPMLLVFDSEGMMVFAESEPYFNAPRNDEEEAKVVDVLEREIARNAAD